MKKKTEEKKSGQVAKGARNVSILRFGITYLLLMGAFFFVIGFTPIQRIIDINGGYTRGVVVAVAWLLHIVRIPCSTSGSFINLPSISLDVKFGCNGLEAVMIYSVAVMAFPAAFRTKLLGIAAGFVVLQLVNIIRIAFLAYSGIYLKNLFDYIHVYVAQGIMIAVSLGIFFLYLDYANNRPAA
jgi:exosortase/archaeosortase family protein